MAVEVASDRLASRVGRADRPGNVEVLGVGFDDVDRAVALKLRDRRLQHALDVLLARGESADPVINRSRWCSWHRLLQRRLLGLWFGGRAERGPSDNEERHG